MADIEHYTLHRAIEAACVTTSALPPYTYANGAAGVGATITINAAGAFPAVNGVSLTAQTMTSGEAINDRSTGIFLLHHGSSRAHNGLYLLTVQGDGGTQAVAMRLAGYDTAATIPGSRVRLRGGNVSRGETLTHRNRKAVTVGTTGIFYHYDQPKARFGRRASHDFTSGTPTILAAAGVGLVAENCAGVAVGTSAAFLACPSATPPMSLVPVNSASLQGVMSGTTGGTATGYFGIRDAWTVAATSADSGGSIVIAQDMGFTYFWRCGVTALSTSVQEYANTIGLCKQHSPGQKVPADCVAFIYDRTGSTNYRAVASAAGVSTGTSIDTGVPVNALQFDTFEIHKDIGDNEIVMSLNGTVVATYSTNIPGDPLGSQAVCYKSVGTTGVAGIMIDVYEPEVQFPQGRY